MPSYASALIFVALLLSSTTYAEPIDITGIDRVKLIKALYLRAKTQGRGVVQFDRAELSNTEAASLVGLNIGYLHGKVMKLTIPAEGAGNEFETWLYDRDNGEGAAQKVVEALKATGNLAAAVATGPVPEKPVLVTLRTGVKMSAVTYMHSMERLLPFIGSGSPFGPFASYQLQRKAFDPAYEFQSDDQVRFENASFLDSRGLLRQHIRDIVLASMGFGGTFIDPLAKEFPAGELSRRMTESMNSILSSGGLRCEALFTPRI